MPNYQSVMEDNIPGSLVDRILFSIIDRLNRSCSHTNPGQVHRNIENFLTGMSAEFIHLLPKDSKGIDIGAGKGIMSKILQPRKTTILI